MSGDIDQMDLAAYRYQVAGQKAEINDRDDLIRRVRCALESEPGASLLHLAEARMASTRQACHLFEVCRSIRVALKLKPGEGEVPAVEELVQKLETVRLVLGAEREESITQAVQDSVSRERTLLDVLKIKFPKDWEEVLNESAPLIKKDQEGDLAIRQKIYDLLGGRPGETLSEAAARVIARLAELERGACPKCGSVIQCPKDRATHGK